MYIPFLWSFYATLCVAIYEEWETYLVLFVFDAYNSVHLFLNLQHVSDFSFFLFLVVS